MVDLELLAERGVSAEAWKKIFTEEKNTVPLNVPPIGTSAKPVKTKGKDQEENPVANLRNRIRLRIQAGRDNNWSSWQHYFALDLLWNNPFRQVSPTLLHWLADKKWDNEDSLKKGLSSFGFNLEELFVDMPDPKTGKSVRRLSVPAFTQIMVPIARAYTSVRRAKIMNDRRMVPFMQFEPAIEDHLNRMRCEVITDRVEMMNRHFNYFSVIDWAVLYYLHYGKVIVFPVEEWFSQEEEVADKSEADKSDSGEEKKDKQGHATRVVKEGLRYHIPHPTRVFMDEAYPAYSMNTGTGVQFAGYWKVVRYKELLNNDGYYNTDRVSISLYPWPETSSWFFQTVYPCQMTFPQIVRDDTNDREARMANHLYTTDMGDRAVTTTEYFEQLIPSKWGLGDYDCPVWARFVVAADDTIIYAAPLAYNPLLYAGYNEDPGKSINSSLSLEICPFEDQFSNLLTQYLYAVRQNLANVTLVDTDMFGEHGETFMKKLEGYGERLFRGRNFFRFSGKKIKNMLTGPTQQPGPFFSASFPQLDTQSIVQAMKMVLDILERVLQMSAQELGAAASHQQSAAEQKFIAAYTGTRLVYTGIPIDTLREAMKKQLYDALMAYGSDEFYAKVPIDPSVTPEDLSKLGFTWDPENDPISRGSRSVRIKAKKSAIEVEEFSTSKDWGDRRSDVDAARAISEFFVRLITTPAAAAIGPDQMITVINEITKMAGFPKELQLRNMTPNGQQQNQEMLKQVMPLLEQLKQGLEGEMKQALVPLMDKEKSLEQVVNKLAAMIQAAVPPPAPAPGMPEPPMMGVPPMGAPEQAPPDVQPMYNNPPGY